MKENKVSKETKKISISDILCFVCAAIFCSIPFVPFVNEMGVDFVIVDGELEQTTAVYSHLVLTYTWYAYFTILVAALIVLATIMKKTPIRLVMLGTNVIVTGILVARANQLVMKIFNGDLYEPTFGYYMLLGAAAVVIVITLSSMMKEKNAANGVKTDIDSSKESVEDTKGSKKA